MEMVGHLMRQISTKDPKGGERMKSSKSEGVSATSYVSFSCPGMNNQQSNLPIQDDCIEGLRFDLGCKPKAVTDAVKLLDQGDQDEVERLGFGAFLKLSEGNISQPQATHWFMRRIRLENDRITVYLWDGLILYITPNTIRRVMGLPCGNRAPLSYKVNQESKRKQLVCNELGLRTLELDDILGVMKECERSLKIKCFFHVLISKILMPTTTQSMNTHAFVYTADMTIIGEFDWCKIVYEQFRVSITKYHECLASLAASKPDRMKSRTIPGCVIMLLTYIVDHMEMPENVESNKNLPRINEYDMDFLMKIIGKAKCRRHGVLTFSNFNVRALEETCYDEASRYHHIDSSRVMESQHSVMMLAAYISGDVPVREINLPLAQKVEGLLLDVQRVAPGLKSRAIECLIGLKEINEELNQDQVDKLYDKHVLSKVGKCGRHNVMDINVHPIAEDIFVNAFKPKGKMV